MFLAKLGWAAAAENPELAEFKLECDINLEPGLLISSGEITITHTLAFTFVGVHESGFLHRSTARKVRRATSYPAR